MGEKASFPKVSGAEGFVDMQDMDRKKTVFYRC